ncbi:MAG: hypothetical protein GWN84_22335 [Gammaproteobacteria bacterium]|nr:hypothetical protein [Gammaproteobacteria bacterium]NIR85373.1 hypothetical protein [Gammaproteobacteria bacterium]NIR88891.1 hypothetical protein [Gammaproteobacteria bacterium]NIU06499.1 hypothetical protein [Gammaproteobacteria bacterium]NIV53392.1 hypothetical protein [Gammaproteobacteria bacterium]
MSIKTGGMCAALAAVLLALGGCYETNEVTVHQPGEYKGKSDPLLEQQASAREESLQKRFELVQTDR